MHVVADTNVVISAIFQALTSDFHSRVKSFEDEIGPWSKRCGQENGEKEKPDRPGHRHRAWQKTSS